MVNWVGWWSPCLGCWVLLRCLMLSPSCHMHCRSLLALWFTWSPMTSCPKPTPGTFFNDGNIQINFFVGLFRLSSDPIVNKTRVWLYTINITSYTNMVVLELLYWYSLAKVCFHMKFQSKLYLCMRCFALAPTVTDINWYKNSYIVTKCIILRYLSCQNSIHAYDIRTFFREVTAATVSPRIPFVYAY